VAAMEANKKKNPAGPRGGVPPSPQISGGAPPRKGGGGNPGAPGAGAGLGGKPKGGKVRAKRRPTVPLA